jgi:TPP-dependent indolepyruvate ferredoxin oxidoreductase alpha subunit
VEIVVGASMRGKRAVGAMKSVGLNVAMEGWINAQGKVFSFCIGHRPFFK